MFSWINSKVLEWYFQKEFKKQKEIKVWWLKINLNNISKKWYFNTEKLWKRLNIDEKNIWNEVFIIYSNPDLWAKWLVWLFHWLKAKEIIMKTKTFCKNKDLAKVKEISMDMANTMKKIILDIFPNAVPNYR